MKHKVRSGPALKSSAWRKEEEEEEEKKSEGRSSTMKGQTNL
jgi:hypothetical protein